MPTAHAAAITTVTGDADRRTVVGSKLALRSELESPRDGVEILVGEVARRRTGIGRNDVQARGHGEAREDPEYGTFKATETERVPSAYYVPAELPRPSRTCARTGS